MNADIDTLAQRMQASTPSSTAAREAPVPAHPIVRTPEEEIVALSAEQLQRFARECFWQIGYRCTEIGSTFAADGGIDLLAYAPPSHPFPWVLAVQVATRKEKVGPAKLRELAGALHSLPVHAGLLITNATFSPQAHWFAQQFNQKHSQKLWLRDLEDLKRWRRGDFQARHDANDIGLTLELYQGGTFALEKGMMTRRWPHTPEAPTPKRTTRSGTLKRSARWGVAICSLATDRCAPSLSSDRRGDRWRQDGDRRNDEA